VDPNVPVEAADVGVVHADPLGHLGGPVLAVHGEEPRRLERPVAGVRAGVLGHAVERRWDALGLDAAREAQAIGARAFGLDVREVGGRVFVERIELPFAHGVAPEREAGRAGPWVDHGRSR
jgi:hypothetical protein